MSHSPSRRRCCLAASALLVSPWLQAIEVRTKLEVHDETWRDPTRDRALPLRIRVPDATFTGPRPVVFFSHGLGGSRAGGAAWGEHWARHGYVVIHLQHPGSDESLWRGSGGLNLGRLRSGASVEQFLARIADVRFVLDELERRHGRGEEWPRRVDLSRMGMSGHSFGARITMALAGEIFPPPFGSQAEPRLRAAIAFSPSTQAQAAAARYAVMRRPFLSITGTLDGDVLGTGATPESRARLWDLQAPPDKYRAVYVGGDHAVFGGGGQGEREWMRALGAGASASTRGEDWGRIQASVQRLSLAFLDAYLKEDAQALAWLREKAGTELAPLASWAVK